MTWKNIPNVDSENNSKITPLETVSFIRKNFSVILVSSVAGYLNYFLIIDGLHVWFKEIINPVVILIVAQLFLGFILGLLYPKKWELAGISSGIILWCVTLFGIITDFNSHNLFPIEIILSILIVAPVLLGTLLGSYSIRKAQGI